MSYVKTTCAVVGAFTTIYLLYSKRQTILYLLFGSKSKKSRGTVKTIQLPEDGDYTISYFEQGQQNESPSLLLFHGFTSTKGTWRNVLTQLPESLHVIAVDLPGHGGTTFRQTDGFTAKDMAERMHQLVQTLGLTKYHVGGQSLGGVVAVVYASLFGSEVTSLIAVCPGMATHPEETEFYRTFSSPEVVRNYLIPETKEEMKFFLEAAVKKKSLLSMPDSHLEIYLNKRKEQNPAFRHMWDVLNVNMRDPAINLCNQHMKLVRCPTLVVWGDSDELVHPHGAQILAEGIKHSSAIVLPDCGHTVTVEKPEVLARHIQEFLAIGSS